MLWSSSQVRTVPPCAFSHGDKNRDMGDNGAEICSHKVTLSQGETGWLERRMHKKNTGLLVLHSRPTYEKGLMLCYALGWSANGLKDISDPYLIKEIMLHLLISRCIDDDRSEGKSKGSWSNFFEEDRNAQTVLCTIDFMNLPNLWHLTMEKF